MKLRLFGCVALVSSLVACSSDDSGPTGNPSTGGSSGAGTVAGTGGTVGGSGGSVATGGGGSGTTAGTSATGGSAGTTVGGGGSGAGGSGGSNAAGSGGGGAVPCPADKSFCSGFEETTLPAGAVYKANAAPGEWTRDFEVDTTTFHSGKSSLKIKSAGTGMYQMLAVPAPAGGKFWARFYIRQAALDIGREKHNAYAGASESDEPNVKMMEFADDVGVAFNANDQVRWPTGFGRINGTPMPFTLEKDKWHCIELSFDSVARVQQLYVEGELKIDAANFPEAVAQPWTVFRFGFLAYNGPAPEIWYDDVAVGPTRPGCLPK